MQSVAIRIGHFMLEPHRQLLCDGVPVVLGHKALSILSVLSEAQGSTVTKGELMEAVWPGLTVEENAMQVHIGALRKILGRDAEMLVTVRGLGYRLDATAATDPTMAAKGRDNSIAVLNFTNMTGNPTLDYLGEGVTEELVNILSSELGLKVPSRTSSFAYKDRHIDARQIASELGVAFLVEGSVRVSGDQMRVTAQLINAEDGIHVWSHNFDHLLADLLTLQYDLARSIAVAIRPFLSGGTPPPAPPNFLLEPITSVVDSFKR